MFLALSPFCRSIVVPPRLVAGQARKLRPGIFINRDPTSSALGPLLSVTPSAHPIAFNFSRLQESGHPAIEWVEPEICNIPRHCDTGIASSSKAALTHRVLGCRTSLLLCLRASNYSACYQKTSLVELDSCQLVLASESSWAGLRQLSHHPRPAHESPGLWISSFRVLDDEFHCYCLAASLSRPAAHVSLMRGMPTR